MFRRILIPTDFSTAAEWVFDDAVRIAGSTGAELIILHIRMTWSSQPGELRFPADAQLYEYAESQELALLRDRIRRANASVTTRLIVRQGSSPGSEICRAAETEQADLVVIATHARHHVSHLFVGSTTMKVISQPPCPVLAIRYGVRKRRAMRRIVVPVHPKQTTHQALELAARVAARERGEVHLVTVCSDNERDDAAAKLRELAAGYSDVTVMQTIERGSDVERELVRYTEKHDADALFLNARADPSARKIDLIRHAPVAVMVVP